MSPAPAPGVPPNTTGPAQSPSAAPAAPGAVPGGPGIHLMRPTERPNEPVTAGLPMGPGPGPEVLSLNQGPDLSNPLVQAVNALNALGPKADTGTAQLRDAMNVALSNQAVP